MKYSPSTPTLETSGPSFPWVENTQGVLKCTTAPGNPPETTYDWIQNSRVINGQTTDTYTIPTLTNVHNGLHIQCRVSNLYTIQRPPAKESNILTLDVQYTPIITLDTTSITVQEGDNPSGIPCSAIGNPTPTIKWYRGNSEQTPGTGTSATLVFSNIDRNQADNYQCKATATGKLNFESSKSVSVMVYYPPAVTVDLQNTTENATNAVFTCNADGFPTNYTYHGWNQYIGSTLVRSYTDFTGMLTESNRKLTLPRVTFEDTGTYHCDVENGFHGRKPDVLQQGSSYFDVRASAKFNPKEEARKPGELHKMLTINITFYSNPQPVLMSGIKWINKTSRNPLTSSDSVSLNLMSTVIQRFVYGKVVTLTGQSAMLTIASLQSFHLGYYQLQIQNGGDLSASFDFQIITSEPETESQTGNLGAIAGGITGTLIAVIILVAIGGVIFYRRRTQGTKRNDSRQNGKFPLTARDQSDEEDGMRDNVLYEPAGPNFVKPGTSGGVTGGIPGGATGGQNDYPYAEVQKNGKNGLDNPVPVYAEVQKKPMKEKTPDSSGMYADVQKPKKEGKGGAKPKKLIGKQKDKKQNPAKKAAVDGTLYENMDDINAQKKNDEKKGKKTKSKKNKDGLIYADILHEGKPNGESRLVIHGLENKTDYAEVDFSRSGKPLPPDNSQTDEQEPPNK